MRIFVLTTLFSFIFSSFGLGQSTQKVRSPLNSIFISEKVPDDFVRFHNVEFRKRLKRILQMGGIQTVNRASEADAEFVFETSMTVTLDGTPDDKTVLVYDCKLRTSTGKQVWRFKKSFIDKGTETANEVFAATSVAENLLKARKSGKIRING